jgi:ubiquinone/menaquinone biosynthesis C-methylase UbiE
MHTSLTSKERETILYYDQHAEEWRTKHKQVGDYGRLEPEFKLFFDLLPKGRIIEIGCGTGEDAINLIDHYGVDNYIGIEPARGLRKIAEENNPKAKFIDTTIYSLVFPQDSFDGFWLCQMLVHIPKDRLNDAFSSLKKVVKKKGIGMVSLLEGNEDMDESRPGRYYSLWTQAKFTDILEENSFKILHFRKLETGASPWLIYIIEKS